jgi:hypothetical protein
MKDNGQKKKRQKIYPEMDANLFGNLTALGAALPIW